MTTQTVRRIEVLEETTKKLAETLAETTRLVRESMMLVAELPELPALKSELV